MVAKIKRHFKYLLNFFKKNKKLAREICRQEKKHKIFVFFFAHFSIENELKTILKSKAIRKSTRGTIKTYRQF